MYEIDHVHVHVGYVYKEVHVNTLEKHSDSGHWLFCGKMGGGNKELQVMLKDEVIHVSTTPRAAPVTLVLEKGRDSRLFCSLSTP